MLLIAVCESRLEHPFAEAALFQEICFQPTQLLVESDSYDSYLADLGYIYTAATDPLTGQIVKRWMLDGEEADIDPEDHARARDFAALTSGLLATGGAQTVPHARMLAMQMMPPSTRPETFSDEMGGKFVRAEKGEPGAKLSTDGNWYKPLPASKGLEFVQPPGFWQRMFGGGKEQGQTKAVGPGQAAPANAEGGNAELEALRAEYMESVQRHGTTEGERLFMQKHGDKFAPGQGAGSVQPSASAPRPATQVSAAARAAMPSNSGSGRNLNSNAMAAESARAGESMETLQRGFDRLGREAGYHLGLQGFGPREKYFPEERKGQAAGPGDEAAAQQAEIFSALNQAFAQQTGKTADQDPEGFKAFIQQALGQGEQGQTKAAATGQGAPPMKGAKLAEDGHWYVRTGTRDGKPVWSRVVQK